MTQTRGNRPGGLPSAKQTIARYMKGIGYTVRRAGGEILATKDGASFLIVAASKTNTIGRPPMTGVDAERIARARRIVERRAGTDLLVVLYHASTEAWCYQSIDVLDSMPTDLVFDGRIRVWPLTAFLSLDLDSPVRMVAQRRLFSIGGAQ